VDAGVRLIDDVDVAVVADFDAARTLVRDFVSLIPPARDQATAAREPGTYGWLK